MHDLAGRDRHRGRADRHAVFVHLLLRGDGPHRELEAERDRAPATRTVRPSGIAMLSPASMSRSATAIGSDGASCSRASLVRIT